MKFFKRKPKLPHLPIEDPLPIIETSSKKTKKWSNKPVKDYELIKELETLNQAISELREKHDLLKKRKYRSAEIINEKKQKPIILKHPESLRSYDDDLNSIKKEIINIENKELGPSKFVRGILPTPPSSIRYPVINPKNFDIKIPESTIIKKESPVKEIKKFINPIFVPRKVKKKELKNPKNLIERLEYGVIELQDKWINVKDKLESLDKPSPEVKEQLSRLDNELNLLKKIKIETPKITIDLPKIPERTTFLNYKEQKRVWKDMQYILNKINASSEINSYELLSIEKHLRELEKIKINKQKIAISIPPTFGHSSSLSNKRISKIKDNIQEKIAEIEFSLPNFVDDILYVEKNLKSLDKTSKQQNKVINNITPSKKSTKIEKAFLQYELNKIQDKLRGKEEKSQTIEKTDQLIEIENKILETDNPHSKIQKGKIILKISSSDKHSMIEITFLQKELNKVEDKIFKRKPIFKPEPVERTEQIIEIERKLAEIHNTI